MQFQCDPVACPCRTTGRGGGVAKRQEWSLEGQIGTSNPVPYVSFLATHSHEDDRPGLSASPAASEPTGLPSDPALASVRGRTDSGGSRRHQMVCSSLFILTRRRLQQQQRRRLLLPPRRYSSTRLDSTGPGSMEEGRGRRAHKEHCYAGCDGDVTAKVAPQYPSPR